MPDMTPAEMERRLADLWAAFDEAGGRGVELAEEIDRLQAALDRHEANWRPNDADCRPPTGE